MTAALDLIVTEVAERAEGIRSFRLARPRGGKLPPFTPGAHVMLRGRRADDGTPAERAYSLLGDPADRSAYEIAVLRQGDLGVSAWLHQAAAPGMRIPVLAPRNEFPLAAGAAEHLLIAGGIGVTPILAMARALAARGAEFAVHYAARSPERMAFRAEMRAIVGERRLATYIGSEGERLDLPGAIGPWRPGRHLYVCGPRRMIEAARGAAHAADWPAVAVHVESFGAAPGAADRPFTVELAQSGKSLPVAPGQGILDVLLAAGVMPSFDCRRGECGACLTRVVAGEPDHRDIYLTEEERAAGEFMTVCVSRSRSDRLVLEL